MEFRILGPLEVVTDEGAIALGGPKQRVLAHMILRANHPVHAERLIDGLWGDEPPETARNTLQPYVRVQAPEAPGRAARGRFELRDEPAVLLGWTPDAGRILLSQDTSLVTVRPDGSGEQLFLQDPPDNGRLVIDWSPDGGWIVAWTPHGATSVSGPARTRVFLIRADGSETFWVGSGAEPSWRPEVG